MKQVLLLVLTISLAGCASYFKKKSCEETNWFEHGKSVALAGKWLNADSHVQECRKLEAEMKESQLDLGFKNGVQTYCTQDFVYKLGRDGNAFSRDLCAGPQMSSLEERYKSGVADYCRKENGYNVGLSGKKYTGICHKDLEGAFLPEYRKGRKKFVSALVAAKKNEVQDLDVQVKRKKEDQWTDENSLSNLETQKTLVEGRKLLTAATDSTARAGLEAQLSRLNADINSIKYRIQNTKSDVSRFESERSKLQKEINELSEELAGLE